MTTDSGHQPAGFPSLASLRAAMRSGELRAVDLVEECLERIARLDPHLHTFVDVCGERALDEAAGIDPNDPRPLAGIPVGIKANRDVRSTVTDHGSRTLAGRRPSEDAAITARLREAGAIIIGTTTCSEFSLLPSCESAAHPATVNPRAPERGPGGSSGGSAAAVAAGLVPIAHANDAAGSLRLPAASCEVVGLALPGDDPVCEGIIGTRLADVHLATVALHQPALIASTAGTRPGTVAVARRAPNGMGADDAASARLERAVEALSSAGWRILQTDPPWSGPVTDHLFAALAPAALARIETLMRQAGRGLPDPDMEPYTQAFVEHAARVQPAHRERAVGLINEWRHRMDAWVQGVDVLITPMPCAPAIGVVSGQLDMATVSQAIGPITAFAWPANALRWPGMAIAGVQLMGPSPRIAQLLTAAEALEQG